ncbi:hypothetical protein H920_08602 [Fukomys damarensis]|uniref:Uncharacterized protein n=1 Tax=Fukomys damarensis TaxID=885580 RepID=A0A091DCX6_FUKDA|nr:hypothetical protein H920_08602 [Fukomys damarensis]
MFISTSPGQPGSEQALGKLDEGTSRRSHAHTRTHLTLIRVPAHPSASGAHGDIGPEAMGRRRALCGCGRELRLCTQRPCPGLYPHHLPLVLSLPDGLGTVASTATRSPCTATVRSLSRDPAGLGLGSDQTPGCHRQAGDRASPARVAAQAPLLSSQLPSTAQPPNTRSLPSGPAVLRTSGLHTPS